jgi:hypothetical protein
MSLDLSINRIMIGMMNDGRIFSFNQKKIANGFLKFKRVIVTPAVSSSPT